MRIFFQDAELHGLRKTVADAVVSKGAISCLNYIKPLAVTKGIIYHGLRVPDEFWMESAKFSDSSILRV